MYNKLSVTLGKVRMVNNLNALGHDERMKGRSNSELKILESTIDLTNGNHILCGPFRLNLKINYGCIYLNPMSISIHDYDQTYYLEAATSYEDILRLFRNLILSDANNLQASTSLGIKLANALTRSQNADQIRKFLHVGGILSLTLRGFDADENKWRNGIFVMLDERGT